MLRLACCILFLACISCSCAIASESPVDFSGNWVVRDKSDSAASDADKSAANHGGHNHAGRSGGGHMGGGGGGMGGGHGSHGAKSENSANASASGPDSTEPVPRLHAHSIIIRQSEDIFDIDADGRRMAYRFDGRHNYGPQYGGTVSLNWTMPEMVIETHPDGGGSIEEHYQLSSDGKTLSLLLRSRRVEGGNVEETRRLFGREGEGEAAKGSGITLP